MKDFRSREPIVREPPHSFPREGMLLTAPPQRAQPKALDVIQERFQRVPVGWDGVIGEKPSDDLLEPSPLFGDRLMHAPSQLLLDSPELSPHAIATGLSLDEELARTVAFADERKAQEVEGLRLTKPTSGAPVRREAAKLDQTGLARMKRQRELLQPLAHVVPEAAGISLVLETDDDVVRVAHENHVARGLAPSPALGPEVEHVVQVDVGKKR